MRLNIYFFIFFISFQSKINTQNLEGRVTYVASMNKALDHLKNSKNNIETKSRKQLKAYYKAAKDTYFMLEFTNKKSLYKIIDKLEIDDNKINLAKLFGGGDNKYITNNFIMNYENTTLDCKLLGECFLVENELPKWELKNNFKIIQGFKCYKAVLRNTKTKLIIHEAWYAPEIPYHYGIMKYYGLPGLILELSNNTTTITATKIELNPIPNIKIEKTSKNIKKISYKSFMKLARKNMPKFN